MCDISDQLELIHKWLHKTAAVMSKEELEIADQLGSKIIDLLNDGAGEGLANGVKLVALFEALSSGAAHMEEHMPGTVAEPEPPSTIQ